jgi:uridine phosphorylase
MHAKLQAVEYGGNRILNFEMETSALFGLSQLLGHSCCSCCAILANRVTGQFTKDHDKIVDKLIETVLNRLAKS